MLVLTVCSDESDGKKMQKNSFSECRIKTEDGRVIWIFYFTVNILFFSLTNFFAVLIKHFFCLLSQKKNG